MEKLYAFWRYDTFPFVLGSEVKRIDDDGFVVTRGYPGMRFKPIKLVPAAAGAKIAAQLEVLRANERKALNAHAKAWRARVVELLPEVDRG